MNERFERYADHLKSGKAAAVGILAGSVLTATSFIGIGEGISNDSEKTVHTFMSAAIIEGGITLSLVGSELRKQNTEQLLELQKDMSLKLETAMVILENSQKEEAQGIEFQGGETVFHATGEASL